MNEGMILNLSCKIINVQNLKNHNETTLKCFKKGYHHTISNLLDFILQSLTTGDFLAGGSKIHLDFDY